MQVALSVKHTFKSRVGQLGVRALRKVFVGYAEYRALETLRSMCTLEGLVCSEKELTEMARTTVIPAYANGWMPDVITLSQLQKWLERRLALSFADPLFEQIGLHQYLLLHCLTAGYDAQKLTALSVLQQCPAAAFVYSNLFDNNVLEDWRSGASVVRMAISALEPKDGLLRWMAWVNTSIDNAEVASDIMYQEET